MKLAGSTGLLSFRSTKWDERVLRLQDNRLSYLSGTKVKNEFSLEGCAVVLDKPDEHLGRPHTFSVHTPADSATEGRVFAFQCQSDMEAVEWAQSLRFSLRQIGDAHPPPPATPTSCPLGETVQTLRDASRDWVVTSMIKSGPTWALSLPNEAGIWARSHAVLTTYCLFLFSPLDAAAEDWSRPVCSIPLQRSELETRLNLIPVGSGGQADARFRFATWFPLDYLALSVDTQEEREEWVAAIQTTMRNCQGG